MARQTSNSVARSGDLTGHRQSGKLQPWVLRKRQLGIGGQDADYVALINWVDIYGKEPKAGYLGSIAEKGALIVWMRMQRLQIQVWFIPLLCCRSLSKIYVCASNLASAADVRTGSKKESDQHR